MTEDVLKYDDQVRETETQAQDLVQQIAQLEVNDERSNDFALSRLVELKDAVKQIEAHKQRYTKPLHDHIVMIRADFDRMMQPAIDAAAILTQKTRAWRAHVDELARKAQEADRLKAERKHDRAVERAEAKGLEPPLPQPVVPTVAPPAKTVMTTTGAKVTFRAVSKFEIVDEAQVPREFMKVDEVKIGAAVRSKLHTAENPIPGVRIWVDKEPVKAR